jgi:hypothetical protein
LIRNDFYWVELPLDVLIRFDALAPLSRRLFAEDLKPNEDPRSYCKERIKCLKSAGWSIDDMVDLARVLPHGFGKLYTETGPMFAAILGELREERRVGRRTKPATATAYN